MMKKIGILLLMIMVIGMTPSVFAQETNFVDANTNVEIRAFNNNMGAEIRLIQLEKNITRNILVGSEVIETIQANYTQMNINNAKNILNELEALLTQVKEYQIEGKEKSVLVIEFVAMKKEAITLTQEFRTETTGILTEEEKQQIRTNVNSLEENELKGINEVVRQKIREYNAERTQTILTNMGINRPEFVQKIINGEITKQEISNEVKNEFQALNQQSKKETWDKIKEQSNKRIIAERALTTQANNKGLERYQEMQSQRTQRLNTWVENNNDNTTPEQGLQRVQEWSQRVEEKMNQIAQANTNRRN
jgi:hypothetical protein